MDSLAHSVASSKLISTPIFYGKRPWPGGPSIQQKWSLPNSMIFYIAKNPSSLKVYQNLVGTCKFFFEKNPILIMANFDALENGTRYHICQNERRKCSRNNYKCCIKIDLNKFSSKIWITQGLFVQKQIQNCISTIVQKNFRFEILCLCVYDNDIIFDDLKVLVSSAERVYLIRSSIKYKNGTIVMFDKILECLSTNCELFYFDFGEDVSIVNASTTKKILKLQNLENHECIYLCECPDDLNVEDLSAFIKKFEDTRIYLDFDENISEEYKEQLDSVIDEIIESDVPDRLILYNGQDEEKRKIMKSRFDNNGITPFTFIDEDDGDEEDDDDENDEEDDDEDEDLEDDDGFDVEYEPVDDD